MENDNEKENLSKIEQQDFNQILYILLILITDLSKYSRDHISNFNEAIEGYIELYFSREFLVDFDDSYCITEEIIIDLEDLMKRVTSLYDSDWMKKLQEKNEQLDHIRYIASKVLKILKVEYVDPIKFSDDHLNYDWMFDD
ncbi:MAG: hypothetical protein U0Y96_10515 [Candidatus Kapaibacterium sp.]